MGTLLNIALRLERGETNSIVLVTDALAHARSADHVFISLFEAQAMREAEAAARRRSEGRPLGFLDGIPIAWKDMFDIVGSRTTAGSLTREDVASASADAPVVANTRSCGLIPLGKTNLTEFAYSGLGLNPHYGTPTADFPVAERRVPGGSSSGSAIAVQRGIVAGAIGTDTAGSVRVPAAFNGLVGFKASVRRCDMSGVYPLAHSLDTIGPIARTISDCVWLDAAMRGLARPSLRPVELRNLAFVVDLGVLDGQMVEPAVWKNLLAFVDRLRGQGARVDMNPVAAVSHTRDLIVRLGWLGAIEAWASHRKVIEGPKRRLIDPRVVKRLVAAHSISDDTVREIRRRRAALIEDVASELDGALLVLPTVKHVAPRLAELEVDPDLFARVNLATLAITMIGSFLGMPGLAIPSGTSDEGLPTSVLFSLPVGEDDRLLAAGLAIEAALAA